MIEQLAALDHALFLFINRDCYSPLSAAFFNFITDPRSIWSFAIIALVSWMFFETDKRRIIAMIALTVLAVSISDLAAYRLIKPFVHRLRPCNPEWFLQSGEHMFLAGGHFLSGFKTSFSFPSNHAMNAFAAASLWYGAYRNRAAALGLFGFAGLIALSRVAVGVHYPFDVLAGALFGTILGLSIWLIYERISLAVSSKKSKIAEMDKLSA